MDTAYGALSESENPLCRAALAEANAKGLIISAGDWEDVLFAYRSQLHSVSATEGMADNVVRLAWVVS